VREECWWRLASPLHPLDSRTALQCPAPARRRKSRTEHARCRLSIKRAWHGPPYQFGYAAAGALSRPTVVARTASSRRVSQIRPREMATDEDEETVMKRPERREQMARASGPRNAVFLIEIVRAMGKRLCAPRKKAMGGLGRARDGTIRAKGEGEVQCSMIDIADIRGGLSRQNLQWQVNRSERPADS